MLAAAKQEGKVVIAGPTPLDYKAAFMKMSAVYPGITIDYTPGGSNEHFPKIQAERQAGQYLWDVYVGASAAMYNRFKHNGFLDPLKPALILPEVLGDQNWVGGFDKGWMDTGAPGPRGIPSKSLVYAFEGTVQPVVYVDRDTTPESAISKITQLTDPQWKGKIAMEDPRQAGISSGQLAFLWTTQGQDFVTKLIQAQAPVITPDRRQLADWIVRGTYPIAIGLSGAELDPFVKQGLAKNVVGLEFSDGVGARMGEYWGAVGLLNKAAHPNAASVFLNWLLSKDGQTAWVAATTTDNSRRTDVPGPEASKPTANAVNDGDEAHFSVEDNVRALAKQLLK